MNYGLIYLNYLNLITNISWNIETSIYLWSVICVSFNHLEMGQFWHDLFVSTIWIVYLCSFNHNTMSNVIPMYFKCCLYLTGCKLVMNEGVCKWMNDGWIIYCFSMWWMWCLNELYEWLCDWDLFQHFQLFG